MERIERDMLLADLGHADEEIRRLAVERLSLLPEAEAVGPLVEALGDPSWRVRKAAVERLAALDDAARTVEALVPSLGDGDNSGRRNSALEALARFGSAAVPALVDASRSADADVRKQAVDALAAIGSAAASDRLGELLGDVDANVRGAAAEALGALGVAAAFPRLVACAQADSEPLVRLSALRSLARLEAPLAVADLGSALADPLLRASATLLLGWSDDPSAWDALLKSLASPARGVREAAMEALLHHAEAALPGEVAGLRERLRAAADPAAFVPDALRRLGEAPLTTRLVIAQFLGIFGSMECTLPLLEAAADDALREVVLGVLAAAGPEVEDRIADAWPLLGPGTRSVVCNLLGRTRGEAGERVLRRALASTDSVLRAESARALAERGSRAALPALVMALRAAGDEESAEERDEIEAAIRRLLAAADAVHGDRIAALIEAEIETAPEGFRLASARLLGAVGSASHLRRIELLLSDPSAQVRRAAVEALARSAPGRLEPLRCALADEAPLVRIGAAAALAASGEADVVADLAGLLEDPEPRVGAAALRGLAAWVREAGPDAPRDRALLLLSVGVAQGGAAALAALDALASIGGDDAVSIAVGALASPAPEIVESAVACIGRHAAREALGERLLPLLGHAAWNVRARVAQVAEERRHVHAMPALMQQLEREPDEFVRAAVLAAIATLERQ